MVVFLEIDFGEKSKPENRVLYIVGPISSPNTTTENQDQAYIALDTVVYTTLQSSSVMQ